MELQYRNTIDECEHDGKIWTDESVNKVLEARRRTNSRSE